MGRSEESFFEEAGKDHMEKHGLPLPHDFKESLLNYQNAEFERRLSDVPGMLDLVMAVSVPRAVASSSPTEILHYKLNKTGYQGLFGDHVYSARMVAHGKPEPDLFLYTAEKMNIAPAECLVIEDSGNGVIAALRAGMKVIGFTDGGHCPPRHDQVLKDTGAHYVANSVIELSDIINDLV